MSNTGFGALSALNVGGMKIADLRADSLTENLGSDVALCRKMVFGGAGLLLVKELMPREPSLIVAPRRH
jgi:hypothetical protein